ncbi:MAG: tetratricopeptide repeat protein [Pseudomonadota bacterium]
MKSSRFNIPGSFNIIVALFIILFLFSGCASDKSKIDKFLLEAQSYYDKGEYQKAVIQIKNAIGIKNDSQKAYDLLSKTYLKLGNGQEAFKAFLKLEQIDSEKLEYKIQLASFYLLGKNKSEAKKRVDQVLLKDPEHIQALFLSAGIMSLDRIDPDKQELDKQVPDGQDLDEQDLNNITNVYQKILTIDPKQAKAHMALAQIYGSLKQFEKTQFHLKKTVDIDPANPQYVTALYRFYLISGQFENAKTVIEDLIKNRPNEAQPLILLSNFYLGQRDIKNAETTLLKAIDVDPKNINPYMLLAKLLNSQKRVDEAEELIQKALKINPDNFNVKNAYADFHFGNEAIEKAEGLVDEILAARPNYLPSKLLKGKILAKQKDWDKAILIFQDLVKEEPNSDIFNLFLGSAYFEKNDLKQAKPFISKALEKNPNLFQARLIMADIYFRQNDLYLAQDHIQKALKQSPKHYNANMLLGNIKLADKQYPTAKAIFEELIEIDPKNPAAYYRLGLVYQTENNPEKALKNFNAALDINPNLMDVFSNLIAVIANQKDYSAAIARCDVQLTKVSDSPIIVSVILNLKGNLLLSAQKTEQGKTTLKQAIDKNPGYLTPYMSLARVLIKQNKLNDAIELYQALIKNRPDQASPHGLIGNLYEQQKKYDLAETHYKNALEINSNYIPAANNLAFLYAQQGKELNKALDLALQAKEKVGKLPAVMDTLGWVYYKKELYDNAVAEFQACVDQEPENPIFNYHLGLALNKKGEYVKAKKALKKALALQKDFNGADDAQKVLDQL